MQTLSQQFYKIDEKYRQKCMQIDRQEVDKVGKADWLIHRDFDWLVADMKSLKLH